jgi:dihydroorotase-like cyclic amidohydrolase
MKLLTLPGLIDIHVHFRDPGQTKKEDFYTGTSAALCGGFTTIVDMPNNKNPIFTKVALLRKIKIARKKAVCNYGFYFGTDGKNISEFIRVKKSVAGLKIYLNETTGNFLINLDELEKIFNAWPKDGGPILLHAENKAINLALGIIEKTKRPTHFCHVSTKRDLAIIIKGKKQGLPITCGITPHHLFLTIDDRRELKGFGTMKPPLATKNDQKFLWKNLQYVDLIESDHAPHLISEKTQKKPTFGVPGLETTLPLLLTAVNQKKLKITDIKRLCFTGPKKLLKIKTSPKDKVVVDLDEAWTINNKNLKTKCKWSPFTGRRVIGKVKKVYLNGRLVFNDSKITALRGFGKNII